MTKEPAGSKTKALKTGTIEQVVHLDAAPDVVYAAFADPGRHSDFTRHKAAGAAVKGGTFSAFDSYISGSYLVVEPGSRLVMTWRTTAWPAGYPPSRLELRFEAVGNGTRLAMRQSEVPDSQVEKYTKGWIANYWEPLKAYFASG